MEKAINSQSIYTMETKETQTGGANQASIQVGNEAERRTNGRNSRKVLNQINKQNVSTFIKAFCSRTAKTIK